MTAAKTTSPHKCSLCSKEFPSAQSLMGHTNRAHSANGKKGNIGRPKGSKTKRSKDLKSSEIIAILRVKREAITDLINLLENL